MNGMLGFLIHPTVVKCNPLLEKTQPVLVLEWEILENMAAAYSCNALQTERKYWYILKITWHSLTCMSFHRIAEAGRDLWRVSSPTSLHNTRSTAAGFSGP